MGRLDPLTVSRERSYIVPGALVPVNIDRDADQGVYIEPYVWMIHTLR